MVLPVQGIPYTQTGSSALQALLNVVYRGLPTGAYEGVAIRNRMAAAPRKNGNEWRVNPDRLRLKTS